MTGDFNDDRPSRAELLDSILRQDLASYTRAVFDVVLPGKDLIWAPYLDLICARLGDVVSGKTRNLIITMPPRHLKSICASVALPTFFLGHNPSAEVMAISYGQDLAKQFGGHSLKVMQSAFYQRIFDTRLVGARPSIEALKTTAGGVRRATSIEGTATGVGADLMIFDDPQKPLETLSDAVRRSTNQAYENTFLSRRNDPATCRMVIVMQRLHEDVFVGHVLGMGADWEVLNLPVIAEEAEVMAYSTFSGRYEFRRAEGEALHPDRMSLTDLAAIRTEFGEAAWASQYMQRPTPAGGGTVQTAWFKRYEPADLPATFERVIQSWDTANKTAEWNDYSVCTTWGVNDRQVYLLDVLRKKLQFPDLRRAVVQQMVLHGANEIYIEDQASGTQLLQELKREGVPNVFPRKPMGDKVMRMAGQTARIEAGFVFIPVQAHWLPEFLNEVEHFPNSKHKDQVDSMSQALDAIGDPGIKGFAYLQIAQKANRARAAENARPYDPMKNPHQPGNTEWAAREVEIAALRAAKEAQTLAVANAALSAAAPPASAKRQSQYVPGTIEWAQEQVDLAAAA